MNYLKDWVVNMVSGGIDEMLTVVSGSQAWRAASGNAGFLVLVMPSGIRAKDAYYDNGVIPANTVPAVMNLF